jgi:hypothetical protein
MDGQPYESNMPEFPLLHPAAAEVVDKGMDGDRSIDKGETATVADDHTTGIVPAPPIAKSDSCEFSKSDCPIGVS